VVVEATGRMVFSITVFSKRAQRTVRGAQSNHAFPKRMVNQRSLGSEWVKQTSKKN